jgi:hypothetical protein
LFGEKMVILLLVVLASNAQPAGRKELRRHTGSRKPNLDQWHGRLRINGFARAEIGAMMRRACHHLNAIEMTGPA